MDTTNNGNLESSKAANIIASQFQKTVSNDSLVIIISTKDASSPATQRFIDELTNSIDSSNSITGIENITNVYSILIPALNQTNQGVYLAFNGGNLTYTLLYSVPLIYSSVWSAAYNQAQTQLAEGLNQTNQGAYLLIDNANMTYSFLYGLPAAYYSIWDYAYGQTHAQIVDGLNQTNQGIYMILDNANLTTNLLYGTPAAYSGTWAATYAALNNANLTANLLYGTPSMYLQAWQSAMTTTRNLTRANIIANQTTAQTLYTADPASYTQYTSHLLAAFDNIWTQSFLNPATATWTPQERVSFASTQVNQLYINTFLADNATAQTFVTALTETFTINDYLNNSGNQTATNIALTNFTIQLLSTTPSTDLPLTDYLTAPPKASQLDNYTITTLNEIAYNQTTTMFSQANPTYFDLYIAPLLAAFHATWAQSFQNTDPIIQNTDSFSRVAYASNLTIQQYINSQTDPTQQAFLTGLTTTLPFQTYLSNTKEQNNAVLTNFAVQTVVTQSDEASSPEFVTAAYNLETNPTYNDLSTIADKIIKHPNEYNMDIDFISTLNEVAYTQTLALLSPQVLPEYAQYITPLLDGFNAAWADTFQNPTTQTLPPLTRASLAANITNQQYIRTALAGNSTMQDFVYALTHSFSLETFLSNTQTQNNAAIQSFAIHYIANQSATSPTFVSATYNLGNTPSDNALTDLANNVIWYPQSYNQTTNFIDTFNQVSYDKTKTILKDADASAFNDYTSHLLDLFNASWTQRVPNRPQSSTVWINQTAAAASEATNAPFIEKYLSDGKDLSLQVVSTLKLADYLHANTTYTNNAIKDITINYVANESGLSKALITAIFDMGENATVSSIETLASKIVSNPEAYNIGIQFNTLISSFVSPSKDVTLISVTFDHSDDANLLAIRDIIKNRLAQNPPDIVSAQVTGDVALNYDFGVSTNEDLDLILPVTIILLVVATGLFFRSIVTPIITLGTIGVGLGVSQIFPYLISTYINPVDYTVSTVLLTVLLGVGTDYSIFVIARHREERINGLPVMDAIKKSIVWAGESIVTSGTTVIISFLALAGTSMVMMQTMGLVVGLGVIVTLLASLTFAPALTAILGDRIFWPNSGKRFERYAEGIREKNKRRGGYFAKSGSFSVKHGKVIILIAVLVTVPTFYVYATTVPSFDMLGGASSNIESIAASKTLTNSFGGGRLMPTYVVVTFTDPLVDSNGSFNMGEMATLQSISNDIADTQSIQEVTGPTRPFGEAIDYRSVTNESDSVTYSGMLSAIGADNQSALITVKFTVDPYSTEAMNNALAIRDSLHANYDSVPSVSGIYVGGTTGGVLDTRMTFESQFGQILPVVVVGVGIVLFIVLGSLILPVFAILSVLMSIVWTLAVTVLVFQSVFNFGLLFITPLILFVLLLGLGMDYNIFILTRIREEATKGQKLNDAIVHAIQQTGGIITAAAIILAGSLGALMLSSNLMLREMGFAFAFSILIDALVVRTYLVPAVMSVFGKWNWYNPIKRLQRIKDIDANSVSGEEEKLPVLENQPLLPNQK